MRETEILRGLTKAKQNCFQTGMVPSKLDELRARAAAERDPRRRAMLESGIRDAELEAAEAAKRAPVAPQPQVTPSQMPGVAPVPVPRAVTPAIPTPAPVPAPAPAPTLQGATGALRGRAAEQLEKKYGFERGTPFVEAPRGVSKHGDKVPAMLEHGEAVLPKETVASVGAKSIQRLIEETTGRSPKQGLRGGLRAQSGVVPVDELLKDIDLNLDPAKAARPGVQPAPTPSLAAARPAASPTLTPPPAAVDPAVAAENARNARAAIDAQARAGARASTTARPAMSAAHSPGASLRQAISGKHTTTVGDLLPTKETMKRAGRGGAGFLRGTLPLAGIEGMVRGFGTGTEEYAERLGIDPPQSFAGDVGLRAAGVLSDVGASVADAGLLIPNLLQHGLNTKNWNSVRDSFADVRSRKAQPAAAQPAVDQSIAQPAATQPVQDQASVQQMFPGGVSRSTLRNGQTVYSNVDSSGQQRDYAAPYVAADGSPTKDWTKTAAYAEGVERANKDKLEAALLDIGEAARTRSGAEGEREKQGAIARTRIGLDLAQMRNGLSAGDMLTHQREMARIGQAQRTAAQEGARKDRGEMMEFLKASYADEKGNVPPGVVQGFKEFEMHWAPDPRRSPEDNRAQMIKEFRLDRQLREIAAKGLGNDDLLKSGTPIKFQKDKAKWGDFGSGGNWLNALMGGSVLRGPDGQVADYSEALNTPEMALYLDKLSKMEEKR